MHRTAPVAAAANPSRAAGTAAPVWREKPQLTLPQQGTGMRWSLSLSDERLRPAPFPSLAILGWHAYQSRPWLWPILAHPGGKSQGLCWIHGRHCPEEDAQHSFYPLQNSMKVR